MNTLTLVPQGGLCNRLRAVLSALSLVEEGFVDARIRVGWCDDAECAARFDQLFEPLVAKASAAAVETSAAAAETSAAAAETSALAAKSSVPTAEASALAAETSALAPKPSALAPEILTIEPRRWYDRPITRYNLHWPAFVRRCLYSAQHANTPPSVEQLQRYCASGRANVYVSTGFAFRDTYSPHYIRRLRPLPHLQKRIDALSADFDAHTVGIHIRRTDHVTAIAESPDSLFEEAIAGIIDRDPEARFYLATDDAQLKARLVDLFPDRITAQRCCGTRSDLRGMEEAVVDLWTLARTHRLIGSYWSSFTDTAAEIGGQPLTILRK